MIHRVILFTLLLLFFGSTQARQDFRFTQEVAHAYDLAMALKLDAADRQIEAARVQDPSNLFIDFVEDYVDFFRVFISEEETEYKRLAPRRSQRLDAFEDSNPESPYRLYAQAEVHLHWALIKFKFEENLAAAREINRAFKLLKRNTRRFPDFAPNLKSLGMLRAGVGTIPDKYRWAVKLLSSLEGTIEGGLQDMRQGITVGKGQRSFNIKEAYIFYAMALLHFGNDGEGAWQTLQNAGLAPEENTVDCFVMANIAMKTQRNSEAIALLTRRPNDAEILPFPFLDFTLGLAKLYRNDLDADVNLLAYVRRFNGINYIKEAYQKLAWHYLIHGDVPRYHAMMQRCLVNGDAVTDEDKHAQKEAESGIIPHPDLLRARLLFDGGYFTKALDFLGSIQPAELSNEMHLEYTYRLGRIYHALGRHEEAITSYDRTIARGSDSRLYFACNAALQAGLIFEQISRFSAAQRYFRTCLNLKPSDYQSSLHQKAKSGLNRIKSKL